MNKETRILNWIEKLDVASFNAGYEGGLCCCGEGRWQDEKAAYKKREKTKQSLIASVINQKLK